MSSTILAQAPIHKNRTTTLGRVTGFISRDSLFRKTNFSSRIYGDTAPFTSMVCHHINGPADEWMKFRDWNQIVNFPYQPCAVGDSFGPTWTTYWFKIVVTVPTAWVGKEVHLRWTSGTEAAVWEEVDGVGVMRQGISPGYREEFLISQSWTTGPPRTYYIEMACNHMFGAGEGSDIAPPNPNRFWTLSNADIAVFNRDIFKLYTDLEMLSQMASQKPNEHIGFQALFAANEMVNKLRVNQNAAAGQVADRFFAEGNGVKVHRLYAMGHCHIDTAWLWPYSETIRKCARSFSAQIRLMDEYPEYVFTCSQAQQYQWMKEYYPDLYRLIKQHVGMGKFIPVGGTWIEMDGNIPNGEAFMRQFFYGQQFYRNEFGMTCKEFWLPDTFGYSAQIPQMIKHVGIDRFMTQKMSWSLVNKFPHHNFLWEGIDGTEVLCHFPPGDSYNMQGSVQELLYSENNQQDKGRANVGIYLYGNGDGGGGPTRTMIERLKRAKDVDGVPQVVMANPDIFFDELFKEKHKLSKYSGELYLELHNGTYTSQAKIKWYNRKCEFLFREIELLMCAAYTTGVVNQQQMTTDMATVDQCWKDFLLNQFHDVLPGSCIELVTIDAWAIYANIFNVITALRNTYHGRMLGATGSTQAIYNPLPWPVKMVVFHRPDTGALPSGPNIQAVTLESTAFEEQVVGRYRVPHAFAAALVDLRPSGYSAFTPTPPTANVTYAANTPSPGKGTFNNGKLRLEVTTTGRPLEQLWFKGRAGNDIQVYKDRLNTGIEPGMFYIYDDVPMFWDAWDVMDYHLETRRDLGYIGSPGSFQLLTSQASMSVVGAYKWTARFGNESSITRYTIMRADSPMIEYYVVIDWREEHKFIKVEWPVDVLSRDATYEIQYGHAKRPTHMNTSWDMAKFEVCGHKWMDISQADKGVSIITDSKYGWHVRDNIVKLSLLKSPKNPDANCDIHKHFIYYAVMPHEGTFQESEVIKKAYELNYLGANNIPLIATSTPGVSLPANWVVADNPACVVEAYKVASAVQRAVCVRFYEAFGGYATTNVTMGFAISKVEECNGLEDPMDVIPHTGQTFTASFRPFEIKSFLISF